MNKKAFLTGISILMGILLFSCGCRSRAIVTSEFESVPASQTAVPPDEEGTAQEGGAEFPDGVWVDEHGYVLSVKDGITYTYNSAPDETPVLLSDGSVSIDEIIAVPADSEKGKEYISALQNAANGDWVFYSDVIMFTFKDGKMTYSGPEETVHVAEYKWNGCEMILTAYDVESSIFIRVDNDVMSMVIDGGATTLFRKGSDGLAQYISENGEDPAQIVGKWYNSDDLSEQWIITGDTVTVNGKSFSYTAAPQMGCIELTFDGNEYTVFVNKYNDTVTLSGEEHITLCSENSDEYKEYQREQKVLEQCGELLSRYPDRSGWLASRNYGDIPLLADADYLDEYARTGYFPVATPEQLASVCYYINTQTSEFLTIELTADIDLSGRQWAPMGWASDNPYQAVFCGNGHTISGLTISSDDTDLGFIGWGTFASLTDISFINAEICGGSSVGIAAGQSIGCSYQNVSVSGNVSGNQAGSLLGYDANSVITDCTADVNVNGEKFEFFSWNEKEKSEIVIENPVEITIDEDHTVHRPEVEGYHNLGWMVFLDGERVLHRNAENEYSYRYFLRDPGTYEIYLTAYVSGQYVPISNTVTYTIE